MWALRHNPIETLHPAAVGAARAATCAGEQGRFWPMHQALFADQKNLDRVNLERSAQSAGIDLVAMRQCLASPASLASVRRDAEIAGALNLAGTPTFLVGRRQTDGRVSVSAIIPGAAPAETFAQAIESALKVSASSSQRRLDIVRASAVVAVGVLAGAVGLIIYQRRQRRQPPRAGMAYRP
jgi:protein-disulfide isomerase